MIFNFLRRATNRDVIDRIHGEIVAAARHPVLFEDYGIEDSLEGRFEAVALHAFLVLRRLNAMEPPGPEMAQDLMDAIFRNLDSALREAGVGDIRVPKHMKAFAGTLLGRADAYDRAFRSGTAALAAALERNVYGGRGNPLRLTRYVRAADDALAAATLDVFKAGKIPFPEPSAV